MKRICVCAALAMLLCGCVTVGTQVDPTAVQSLQRGVTTLTQAEARLGVPNGTATLPNGETVITYVYTHAQASAASYVPVVGLFAGHSDAHTQTVTLTFDSAGRFLSAATSDANVRAKVL